MGGYPTQAMLHAQKRMVSMMARVALSNDAMAASNDRLQRQFLWLTRVGVFLAAIAALFTIAQTVIGVVALCPK